jgi:hypothetical protein
MEAGGPMLGVWWVLGCGEPGPVRSEPVTPTVTFEEGKAEEIIWTDLEEVFPKKPAALPEKLQALVPGMDGSAARDVLMAAHQPGVKVFAQPVGEDSLAVASILVDTTNVGVTLLMDGEGRRLQSVDISLPDDVAIPMLTIRWGDPTETTMQDGGLARYRWDGEPWTAELHPDPERKKAIVKYTPAKPLN